MEYKDYYKVLGVSKTANQEEIRKAYRALAIKLHPDKNQGDNKAEERFKEVNEAYEVLGDPEKRKKYDQLGNDWKQYQEAGQGAYEWSGYQGAQPGTGGRAYYQGNYEDIFGGEGDFSDFFNAFFGNVGSHGNTRKRAGARGQDLSTELEVTLEEAFKGTSRILGIDDQKIRIKLKPGVHDGQELRIKGKGGKGVGAGESGDIYLKIKIVPGPDYYLKGKDIIYTVPVDVYTAILGGKIEVETLAGRFSVPVPKGSQNGRRLRLKGKGMPVYDQNEQNGDLYLQINVVIPSNLNEEELKLFNRLQELNKK
jgi:curved DNA-binding protein